MESKLKELVLKSRSYRTYNENRKISKEELEEMVDCARVCPSSVNMQPLKYYLAWESEEVSEILNLTNWAAGLPEQKLPPEGKGPTAFIVICQDKFINENLNRFQKDIGIVAQVILLRAAEMELGGCMIGNFNAFKLREVLDLPDIFDPLLVVAIGQPEEDIVLVEVNEGEDVKYYRDEHNTHFVPKRKLIDVVI